MFHHISPDLGFQNPVSPELGFQNHISPELGLQNQIWGFTTLFHQIWGFKTLFNQILLLTAASRVVLCNKYLDGYSVGFCFWLFA